jgi:hypothetical protein
VLQKDCAGNRAGALTVVGEKLRHSDKRPVVRRDLLRTGAVCSQTRKRPTRCDEPLPRFIQLVKTDQPERGLTRIIKALP